jgi:hypothetical protein
MLNGVNFGYGVEYWLVAFSDQQLASKSFEVLS